MVAQDGRCRARGNATGLRLHEAGWAGADDGIPDAVETIYVKHKKGQSVVSLKSYDQRREAFQGTEQDLIWLDEEPPLDIYSECLIRTMTTDGLLMLTFTPLMGMSDVVRSFLVDGKIPL